MANTNSPFGFKPIQKYDGSSWNGQVIPCFVPSTDGTALFVGDPVDLAGSSNANTQNTYKAGTLPTVTKATAGATNKILGFVVAVHRPQSTTDSLSTLYRAASTNAVVYIALANNLFFEAQADEDIEQADIGSNADYVVGGGGSTVTGYSSAQIDSSSIGAGATKQLLLWGLSNVDNNALGNYAKCKVIVNQLRIAPATAGI